MRFTIAALYYACNDITCESLFCISFPDHTEKFYNCYSNIPDGVKNMDIGCFSVSKLKNGKLTHVAVSVMD